VRWERERFLLFVGGGEGFDLEEDASPFFFFLRWEGPMSSESSESTSMTAFDLAL
jgi:hypothetical protein